MGTSSTTAARRAVQMMIGVAALAAPGAAQALSSPTAQSASRITVRANARRLAYGQREVIRGTLPASEPGPISAKLEYEPLGGHRWRVLDRAPIRSGGRYLLEARLRRSGWLRVLEAPSPFGSHAAAAATSGARSTTVAASHSATPSASLPIRIAVAARLIVAARLRPVALGSSLRISGRMLPAQPGREVRLLGWLGGRWRRLPGARIGPNGRFTVRYRPRLAGLRAIRLWFAGDRLNASISASAGQVAAMTWVVASWYDDAGQTACGFHAFYGVANRTLPCGTRVSFSYAGRTVTATVDDRGPFVPGRDYDLNQNTAAALGMWGVASLQASIG